MFNISISERLRMMNLANWFGSYHEEMMKRKDDSGNRSVIDDYSKNSRIEESKKGIFSRSLVHMKEWSRDIYNTNYFTK